MSEVLSQPQLPAVGASAVLAEAWSMVVRAFRRQIGWYRQHALLAGGLAVVAFVVGWGVNAAILAVKYDGYRVAPGSAAIGVGNRTWGPVFWTLLPGLIAAAVVYTVRVGPSTAARRTTGLPKSLLDAYKRDGRMAGVHLLSGLTVSLLISVATVPLVNLALAGWLALLLVGGLRRVVTSLVAALWYFVTERLRAGRAPAADPTSSLVVTTGVLGGLVLGWVVSASGARLVLGILAGVAAVMLNQRRAAGSPTPTVATVPLILAGVAAAVVFVHNPPAVADDGGWKECGNPGVFRWITKCGGSWRVIRESFPAGPLSVLGTLFGLGAGGANSPDDLPPCFPGTGCNGGGQTPMSPEREAVLKWRALNPDASPQDFQAYQERVKDLHAFEQEPDDPFYARWWRDFNRYNEEVGNALWEDYDSGNMGDRLRRMPKHVPMALVNGLKNMVVGLAQQGYEMSKAGGPTGYALKMTREAWDLSMKQVEIYTAMDEMQRNGVPPAQISAYAKGEMRKIAPGIVDGVDKYVEASLKNDNETTAKITTDVFGEIMVMAVTGKLLGPKAAPAAEVNIAEAASTEMMANAAELRAEAAARGEAIAPRTGPIFEPPPLDPPLPRTRAKLMELAEANGSVKLTPAEARQLGLEQGLADDLWDHHLRWGGSTEFKLGAAENVAMREGGQYQAKPGCYVDPVTGKDAPSLLVKSINETDVRINPELAGKERVVSFVEGAEPPRGSPEHARWEWRQQERVDLKQSMETLKTEGGIRIDENGRPTRYWVDELPDGTLVDRETGRPFIPDNDTYTGNPGALTPDQYQASLYKLGRGTIQHPGDTPNWHIPLDDPDFAYKVKVKNKVIADVEKEGRVLIDADGVKFCKTPSTGGGSAPPAPGPPGPGAPGLPGPAVVGSGLHSPLDATDAGPPPGYSSPAPGGGAPPGYSSPAPGGGAPPGYD